MALFDFGKKKDKVDSKEEAELHFIDLKKKATHAVQKRGLGGQRARVALVLDISGSMSLIFQSGAVQRVCERILALAVKFDDNGTVDIFLFGGNDYEVGELHESQFYGYVDREIRKNYKLERDTHYAGVMHRILKKYSAEKGDPAYVMFLTDGDCSDNEEAEQVIIEASKTPIFWQFVGLGSSQFSFLEKLDTISGRFIDNANFFQVNDIDQISEEELYDRLLQEFPDGWLRPRCRHLFCDRTTHCRSTRRCRRRYWFF